MATHPVRSIIETYINANFKDAFRLFGIKDTLTRMTNSYEKREYIGVIISTLLAHVYHYNSIIAVLCIYLCTGKSRDAFVGV